MKTINVLDTIIVSNNHHSRFAGRIGFIMDIRNDNDEKETRFDVQFPYHHQQVFIGIGHIIEEQHQFGINDIVLLQSFQS